MSLFKNTLDEELDRPITRELLHEYNFELMGVMGGYITNVQGFHISEGDRVYKYMHMTPKADEYPKSKGGDYLFWNPPSWGPRHEWKRVTDFDIIYFPSTYTGYKINCDNGYMRPTEQIYVEIPRGVWEFYLSLKFEQRESLKIDGQWLNQYYLLDCKNKRDLLNILLTFEDIERKLHDMIWQ